MADHRERDSYYSQTDLRSKNDDPPNSRLFVICHKSLEEDDLRKAFEKFGKIEDIWVVKDRNTGENKGDDDSTLPVRANGSRIDIVRSLFLFFSPRRPRFPSTHAGVRLPPA